MKIIESYKEDIPDYALSYLINGDASGLSDEDKKIIDDFMQEYYEEAKKVNGHVIIEFVDIDDEGSFVHFPAFGLACTAIKCVILICK